MFFTYASRILSILALVGGFTRFLIGLLIAIGWTDLPYDLALARYAPGASSSGQAIDEGLVCIVFAVALGTLAEISFALRKKHN
jgi:hypothetical protein